VRRAHGASNATHTGAMYSSETATVTPAPRMAAKKSIVSRATTKPSTTIRRTHPERRTSSRPWVRRKTAPRARPPSAILRTRRRLAGMVEIWMSVDEVPRISDDAAISA